jgi:hypothetical protein
MRRSIKDAFEQGVNELMLWEIPEEYSSTTLEG